MHAFSLAGAIIAGVALVLAGAHDAAAGIGGFVPDGKSQWVVPVIVGLLVGGFGVHIYQRYRK